MGGNVALAQNSYWQQRVDTRMDVVLDDEQHLINGRIEMDYFNNSPDTLSFIYFHLWPNAYKTDRTAFEQQAVEDGLTDHYFAKDKDRGYIDSLYFVADDSKCGIVVTQHEDIIKLVLPTPLLPGAKTTITSPFRVKIPLTFSRLGHNGNAYQISQWFPKPAVYDRKGWHPLPYLNQGEFYSEFGSYDVAITLPQNYIVMGTGNITDAAENAWLDSLSALSLPPDTLYKKQTPISSTATKTIHFQEDNVHDFAWFADKRWVVRQEKFSIGDNPEITAYSCFLPVDQQGWKNSAAKIKETVIKYSSLVGTYPYRTVKAVEGDLIAGGGMEYPTVTVIQKMDDEKEVNVVVAHEVGHNWFYGILGTNEREHAWMDEGINSLYEHKVQPSDKRLSEFLGTSKDLDYLGYAAMAASRNLLPADTTAYIYPAANYGADVYGKASYFLEWLEDYMGKESFQKAMQQYFNEWKFKHPYPEDFEQIFRASTDKNLDWFFAALHSSKPVDYKIKSVKKKDGLTEITVKNKTGFLAPVKVILEGESEAGGTIAKSGWSQSFVGKTTFTIADSGNTKWHSAYIAESVPDYKSDNNLYKNGSTFHPKLGAFAGLNMSEKSKTWLAPAIGYNYYDGFMAGLLLHNVSLPQNKFQYILAPLYAFGSKQFVGTGIVGYTAFMDGGALHNMQFNLEGKTFSYRKSDLNVADAVRARFIKIAPEVIFNFRKPYPRSSVSRSLSVKGYWIREDRMAFQMDGADSLYRPSIAGSNDNYYGRMRYNHTNERTFNPFSYTFESQVGKQFAKISLEANLKIDYFIKDKGLYIRGFAGKFFSFTNNDFESYRYRLATTYTGANDYLYDETYLGRNEQTGFTSQQISMKEGGFKINTLQYANQIGLSNDWLFALNLKSDLPFWNLPVRLFADIGTFSGAKKQNPSESALLYVAGLEVYISDYLTINLPLVMSKDYKEYVDGILGKGSFAKTISFSLNLSKIDWLNGPSKLLR